MYCGLTRRSWISASLALFMVFVVPMCWFGALARAKALNIPGPSSSNNNEEREEHEETEISVRDAQGSRPPVFAAPELRSPAERVDAPAPRQLASVAHLLEPSVFSVRRLL
jgi:hypothetical protein